MKFKRVLCALGIVGALTGCGPSKNTEDDNTIKMMSVLIGTEVPDSSSDLHKEIERITGYKLDVNWVLDSSYNDRVSITMVSNDVPQIMTLRDRNSTTVNNVQNGAFWNLGDYLENYPNLSQANPSIMKNSSFNGEVYGIYRGRDLIRGSVIIRKDWLNNLGLEEPSTLEEFKDVLHQFTYNDPNQSGKDDTYGMIVPQWPGPLNSNSPFDQMSVWFGVPNVAKVENDEVVMDFMTEEYLESLDLFKELYDERLMNNDFAIMDPARWDEPFVTGRAGVIVDVQSRGMVLRRKMLEHLGDDGQNGDSYVAMIGNMATDSGNFILPTPGFAGIHAIPRQGVRNEEELAKVLDFLDKLNTKEGNDLLTIGVEGVHYTYEEGSFTPTSDRRLLDELLNYSQLGMNVPGHEITKSFHGTELERQRIQIMTEGPDRAVFNPVASYTTKTFAQKGAQLQNIMSDARIQYIAGQIDKKGYLDAVELWKRTGGNEYLEELTDLYNGSL